ncbi:hypothetical protein EMMF5_002763 [Cystobasidiomycetes sp. EMM_F5]
MSEADGEAGPSSPRAAKGQHRGSISQSIGSPSRSVSPSGDKGRQQLPNIQTGSERRRDHVSVGNRVSRIVVTRPPYAARDDLDFERRARSSTVGSNTGSAHNDRSHKGRHPGIQPSAYASPTRGGVPGDGQSSQLSSSTATAVEDGAANNEKHNAESTEANGEKGKQKEKTEQDNLNQPGSQPSNQAINPRPSVERMASNDPSRWMAFTLPTRYKKRFDEYMAQRAKEEERREREEAANADESSNSDDSDRNDAGDYFSTRRHTRRSNKRRRTGDFINDAEEGRSGSGQRRKPKTTSRRTSRGEDREGSGSSRRQHGHGADVISANQAQTPGWASPWNPGTAGTHRQNSFGALAMEGLGISHFGQEQKKKSTRLGRFQKWLVRSAFAPLFLRIANLAFTISELAVAIHIRQLTLQNNVYGILGSSTIFGVVVGPLSIVHIFVNVYVEYFGSPIGVWKVRSKMYYTLVELLFM